MSKYLFVVLLASVAAADDIYLKSGGSPIAKDVMVVGEKDGKVLYLDKSMKERSWDASMVGRIEKSRCDVHEFVDRSEAAKSADEVVALAEWAEEKKFRKEVVHDLYVRAVGIDPMHARANEVLGNVLHEGEWMTPAERDRRVQEAEDAAMRAKGLVRWNDEWVTPEDKAKLEQGLRKYKGVWMTEDQIKEDQGFVKHNGKWIKKDELEVLQILDPAREDSGLGNALKLVQTENFAILSDLADAEMQTLGDMMERLHKEWLRVFPSAKDSRMLAGKYRLYVFKKTGPYKHFVKNRYERQREAEKWSDLFAKQEKERLRLRLRETSFWEVQPHALSAHAQMPDPFELLKAHVAHFAANVMATRHGRVRFPTWWLNEGIGYYFEKRASGTIATFNTAVGGGGYADAGPVETSDKNPWLDHQRWQDLLGQMARNGSDPPLDQIKGKDLYSDKNRLSTQDLAKAWSVVTYLIQDDAVKFAAFVDSAKQGKGSPVEREVAAVIEHYGSYRNIDEGWRKYALNGFRIAR